MTPSTSLQEYFAVATRLLVRCNGCVQVAEWVYLGCYSRRKHNTISLPIAAHLVTASIHMIDPCLDPLMCMHEAIMCLKGCLLSRTEADTTTAWQPLAL